MVRRAGCHRGSGIPSLGGPPPGNPLSGGPSPRGISSPWLLPGSGSLLGFSSIVGFFPLAGVDGSPFCRASSSACSGMLVSRVIVCVAIFLDVGVHSCLGFLSLSFGVVMDNTHVLSEAKA